MEELKLGRLELKEIEEEIRRVKVSATVDIEAFIADHGSKHKRLEDAITSISTKLDDLDVKEARMQELASIMKKQIDENAESQHQKNSKGDSMLKEFYEKQEQDRYEESERQTREAYLDY